VIAMTDLSTVKSKSCILHKNDFEYGFGIGVFCFFDIGNIFFLSYILCETRRVSCKSKKNAYWCVYSVGGNVIILVGSQFNI